MKKFLSLILVFLFSIASFALEENNQFKILDISKEREKSMLNISWNEKAPVKLQDLREVIVTYNGFDKKDHIGSLIVHKDVSEDILNIFKELYEKKFPIEKIQPIDLYGANDEESMKNNNTSAFCFRSISASKNISNHAYGFAIDINPKQNPYIKKNIVKPSNAVLKRNSSVKGIIERNSICYNAFKKRGWTWGGEWKSLKDYQHFEKSIKSVKK